ncbi:helix-turn-helix domain-containing protein [Tengunoibacter tsumagoiensis]|nr:helix-turn-helix domain-containing protein [Tengunoibacter tsumagoiensis]
MQKNTLKAKARPGLVRERLALHLSQQELAEKLGTTSVTVSRWEHGHVQPSAYYRQLLCEIFDKTPEELQHLLKLVDVAPHDSMITPPKKEKDLSAIESEPLQPVRKEAVSAHPQSLFQLIKYSARQRLLNKVEAFWVRGILEKVVPETVLMRPGFSFLPDAIHQPWDDMFYATTSLPQKLTNSSQILQLYDELGGELLILGDPGSGKTTLLLELTKALVQRAQEDETHPIPVVFQLSSWTQKQRSFGEWLECELKSKYQVPLELSRRWVEMDTVLPLLDGFDEIPVKERHSCLQSINQYRQEHGLHSLVVCSRISEYLQLEVQLQIRGAISLHPLTAEQILCYLTRRGAAMSPLREALEQDAAFMELATNPLMLHILTLTYAQSEQKISFIDKTLDERKHEILSLYVQRVFQHHMLPASLRPEQALNWLGWLARQMKEHSQSIYYIESMQPDWLSTEKWREHYELLAGRSVMVLLSMLLCLGIGTAFRISNVPYIFIALSLNRLLIGGLIGWIWGVEKGTYQTKNHKEGQVIHRWCQTPGYLKYSLLTFCFVETSYILISNSHFDRGEALDPFIALNCAITTGIITLVSKKHFIKPAEVVSWSWTRLRKNLFYRVHIRNSLLIALLFDVACLLSGEKGFSSSEVLYTSIDSVLVWAFYWIGVSFFQGFAYETIPEASRVTPNYGIIQSFLNSLFIAPICSLFFTVLYLIIYILFGILNFITIWDSSLTEVYLLHHFIFGLCVGMFAGLSIGLLNGGIACIRHYILRFYLWKSGVFAWDCARFLDQMASYMLLRKVGGGYIFLHRMLLEYFVEQDRRSSPVASSKDEKGDLI